MIVDQQERKKRYHELERSIEEIMRPAREAAAEMEAEKRELMNAQVECWECQAKIFCFEGEQPENFGWQKMKCRNGCCSSVYCPKCEAEAGPPTCDGDQELGP